MSCDIRYKEIQVNNVSEKSPSEKIPISESKAGLWSIGLGQGDTHK